MYNELLHPPGISNEAVVFMLGLVLQIQEIDIELNKYINVIKCVLVEL